MQLNNLEFDDLSHNYENPEAMMSHSMKSLFLCAYFNCVVV